MGILHQSTDGGASPPTTLEVGYYKSFTSIEIKKAPVSRAYIFQNLIGSSVLTA